MKFTIDFAAIWHSIRRWAWQEFGPTQASETQCVGCGKELTRDEAHYYIVNCERCEGISMAGYE